ncbi:MAG: sulfite exporter TauE/SafE family protein, partial [Deltaproteobacteria bacterium]|nr:sulfite exporter TauE/SafE family protein [Deltaproteobacteria bacterium]
MMSSTLTAIFLAVIFFAGFTQGLTGFGSILISVSILAMVMDLQLIIPLV